MTTATSRDSRRSPSCLVVAFLRTVSHPSPRLRAPERLRNQAVRGKLVLVSAMTPTKYGEGKTTTTIGLTQGLVARGHRAMAALRLPSMGPILGAKGGGPGGGKATLESVFLTLTGRSLRD